MQLYRVALVALMLAGCDPVNCNEAKRQLSETKAQLDSVKSVIDRATDITTSGMDRYVRLSGKVARLEEVKQELCR